MYLEDIILQSMVIGILNEYNITRSEKHGYINNENVYLHIIKTFGWQTGVKNIIHHP